MKTFSQKFLLEWIKLTGILNEKYPAKVLSGEGLLLQENIEWKSSEGTGL